VFTKQEMYSNTSITLSHSLFIWRKCDRTIGHGNTKSLHLHSPESAITGVLLGARLEFHKACILQSNGSTVCELYCGQLSGSLW